MKFIADKEGKEVLTELLDIALKQNGIKSLQAIVSILNSIEDYKETEVEEAK